MSDTCIVCLGDLNASAPPLPLPPVTVIDPGDEDDGGGGISSDANDTTPLIASSPSELIAHLLPCGHNLHDECLKPWVERANSCPICRQNFNEVELCQHLNGPIVSSYPVADRTQVAEIDPSMLIEEVDEEPEFPPCSKCGQDDHEDVLMLCDGCEQASHTYCVGIDAVPVGHWFCEECLTSRALESAAESSRAPRALRSRPSGTRTRAEVRRARNRDQRISSDWARVWQAVSDRAGFDLDFPHEGGSWSRSANSRRRRAAAWERRLQVAERQGASNRFREGAAEVFLDRPTVSRPRPEPPEPESFEELLAWNAFEKARDIQADPVPKRKRKSSTNSPSADSPRAKKRRKSRTASPSEPLPAPQPERRLKRPQTRRAFDIQEPSSDNGESSSSRRRSLVNGHLSPDGINGTTPSFLQSLLKEVESSAIPDEPSTGSATTNAVTTDHPSPGQISSPGGSPTASNHPSPRAMSATPPPMSARSNSPAPLTSKVEPIFPAAPDLTHPDTSLANAQSPTQSQHPHQHRRRTSKSQTRVGRWALQTAQSSSPPRPRSEEASPTRLNMSLSAKESIQRLVKEALKLPYSEKKINKDEYTDINRSVSRMLYEEVGEDGNVNGDLADVYRKKAFEEVEKALSSLQAATL